LVLLDSPGVIYASGGLLAGVAQEAEAKSQQVLN
jgi:hypothetical protein